MLAVVVAVAVSLTGAETAYADDSTTPEASTSSPVASPTAAASPTASASSTTQQQGAASPARPTAGCRCGCGHEPDRNGRPAAPVQPPPTPRPRRRTASASPTESATPTPTPTTPSPYRPYCDNLANTDLLPPAAQVANNITLSYLGAPVKVGDAPESTFVPKEGRDLQQPEHLEPGGGDQGSCSRACGRPKAGRDREDRDVTP